MAYAMTAEDLFKSLKQMLTAERQKFFSILSMNIFRDEDMRHEQLFGLFAEDEFTAAQAAEYLEVSTSTSTLYCQRPAAPKFNGEAPPDTQNDRVEFIMNKFYFEYSL